MPQPTNPNSDEVLDLPQAAALIRVPESTMRYWRHLGTGPKSFKIGRRVKYLRSDVEAYIRACRTAN